MRKIILENDHNLGITPPADLKRADGTYDLKVIRNFVAENWKQVSENAQPIMGQRIGERTKQKKNKLKAHDGKDAS
jgi:predicted RNA-binding protein with PUA domain